MAIFQFRLWDDRFAAPFVTVKSLFDSDMARRRARHDLQSSVHFRSIEVSRGGSVIFSIDRRRRISASEFIGAPGPLAL